MYRKILGYTDGSTCRV